MSLTCLSRTLDERDYAQLEPELRYVDHRGINGHHPARRWEYGLALHATGRWKAAGRTIDLLFDVGSEHTNFHHMLDDWTERHTVLLDPSELTRGACRLLADIVTCLGVIDHVTDPEPLLYYLSSVVAPGGLLVLTMAYWNKCGSDTAVNHDLRRRIYCPKLYATLRAQAQNFQLLTFGGFDPTWHGTQVHDYSLASLVLQKRG